MPTPSHPPIDAWIALGANLGDAPAQLLHAMQRIHALPHTQLVKASSLYRSAPVDAQGPDFINAVVQVRTELAPLELLTQLQSIENEAGRLRPYRNAPRTLDLDILRYGSQRIDTERLTVPHPRMHERAFALLPLQEIAPELVDAQQLEQVRDQAIEKSQAIDLTQATAPAFADLP